MAPNRVRIGSWGEASSEFDAPTSRTKARGRSEATWLWDGGTLARWIGVTVGILVAAVAIGAAAVAVLVDVDALTSQVAPRASAFLNRPVRLEGARLVLLPRPSVRIRDVRIGNQADFEGPPLALAQELRLRIALRPLLRGVVSFDRAHVSGLSMHAGVDADGTPSFGDLVPAGWAAAADTLGLAGVAIGRVTVDGATLTYRDEVLDRALLALDTDAELEILHGSEGRGWSVRLLAMPDSLHLKWSGASERIVRLGGPEVALTLTPRESGSGFSISEGAVTHEVADASVNGLIEALDGRTPRVLLRFENPDLDASRLTSLLSPTTRAEHQPYLGGSVALSLEVSGLLGGEALRMAGTVAMKDGSLRLRGEPLVEGVSGTVVIDGDSIVAESVAGVLASGPFDLVGSVHRPDGHGLVAVHAQPDLAVLQRVGALAHLPPLSGDAVVSMALRGALESLDSVRAVGSVALRGVRAEPASLGVPVYVPAAELSVNGAEIHWTASEVLVGEARLVTEGALHADLPALWRGEAEPHVDMDVRGESLDLSRLLLSTRGLDAPSYPHLAFAHLSGRPVDGRPARIFASESGFSRPRALPLRGSVRLSLAELAYRELVLDSLVARLTFTDSMLTVDETSFGVWGGSVDGTLRIGAGDALDEPFHLVLRGDSLDAASFLSSLTPVDQRIDGVLAVDLDVQGTTDLDLLPVPGTPRGHVRVTLSDGSVSATSLNLALGDFLGDESWHDIPFTSWSSDLRLGDEVFEVASTRLAGDFGEIQSSGSLRLDGGGLDLSVRLAIAPERLGEVSLRRTGIGPGVLGRLQEAGEPLELGLRVGGSLAGPTVEPDALAVSEAARRPGG